MEVTAAKCCYTLTERFAAVTVKVIYTVPLKISYSYNLTLMVVALPFKVLACTLGENWDEGSCIVDRRHQETSHLNNLLSFLIHSSLQFEGNTEDHLCLVILADSHQLLLSATWD